MRVRAFVSTTAFFVAAVVASAGRATDINGYYVDLKRPGTVYCMKSAEAAVGRAGMKIENFTALSMWIKIDDYAVYIDCSSKGAVAYLAGAGPDAEALDKIMTRIARGFQGF